MCCCLSVRMSITDCELCPSYVAQEGTHSHIHMYIPNRPSYIHAIIWQCKTLCVYVALMYKSKHFVLWHMYVLGKLKLVMYNFVFFIYFFIIRFFLFFHFFFFSVFNIFIHRVKSHVLYYNFYACVCMLVGWSCWCCCSSSYCFWFCCKNEWFAAGDNLKM